MCSINRGTYTIHSSELPDGIRISAEKIEVDLSNPKAIQALRDVAAAVTGAAKQAVDVVAGQPLQNSYRGQWRDQFTQGLQS